MADNGHENDPKAFAGGDTSIIKGDQPTQDSPCTTRLRWQNGLLSQTIFNHAQHFNGVPRLAWARGGLHANQVGMG